MLASQLIVWGLNLLAYGLESRPVACLGSFQSLLLISMHLTVESQYLSGWWQGGWYEGEWADGERHGTGVRLMRNGTIKVLRCRPICCMLGKWPRLNQDARRKPLCLWEAWPPMSVY